jgi:REP element-mobilizing transposase RayT
MVVGLFGAFAIGLVMWHVLSPVYFQTLVWRFDLWTYTDDVITQHPETLFFGNGLAWFARLAFYGQPHNTYLYLLMEYGVFGLLLKLLLFGYLLWNGARLHRRGLMHREPMLRGLWFALFFYFLIGMVESTFLSIEYRTQFLLFAVPYVGLQRELLREHEVASEPGQAILVPACVTMQLARFSQVNCVQAITLSRCGKLLAQVGELSDEAMAELFAIVEESWQTNLFPPDSLVRYITLPRAGDYLFYSVRDVEDRVLSMVFDSKTSMRTIRCQARRLSEALTGESQHSARGRLAWFSPPVDAFQPATAAALAVNPIEDSEARRSGYTFLWMLADPDVKIIEEYANRFQLWLAKIIARNSWQVIDLDIWPDCIMVSLEVPHKLLPDEIIVYLMTETARRAATDFPDIIHNPAALWADAYYVALPARHLSEREVACFVADHRQKGPT